jgi:hypothetical protein
MDAGRTIGIQDAPYRSPTERLEVIARRLHDDRDCWFVTGNVARGPHAVPLSFLADGLRVILATAAERPAARNALEEPRVLLLLAGHGDAVRLSGESTVAPFEDLDENLRSRYLAKAGWDPASAGFVALIVRLDEIRCSRSPAEDEDQVVWKIGAPIHW